MDEPREKITSTVTFLGKDGRPDVSMGIDDYKKGVEAVIRDFGTRRKKKPVVVDEVKASLDPDRPVPIPEDHHFIDDEDHETDFLQAQELRGIALNLINTHETRFSHLANASFVVLWKRIGGSKAGKFTLGQTQRTGGLVRFYAEVEFVIWLAADHLRILKPDRKQIDALLFHELCHIAWDPMKGRRYIVGHDFQGFIAEVKEYGAWMKDLELAARVMQQLPLFAQQGEEQHG